jgi:hypothetical protein
MSFNQSSPATNSEMNAPLGVLLLLAVLAVVVIPHPAVMIPRYAGLLSAVWDKNTDFLSIVLVALVINCLGVFSVANHILGTGRSGKKLERLSGTSGDKTGVPWIPIACGVVSLAVVYGFLFLFLLSAQVVKLGFHPGVSCLLNSILRLNFSIAASIVVYWIADLPLWKSFNRTFLRGLPVFPKLKNALVLGSVNEEEPTQKPSWAVLGLKGLVGNLLITGSIGTGKSSGTIFPYLDQILTNFDPKPALLTIDPKGKITGEIKKIVGAQGMSDRVLHMKLGGSVTFNPIYRLHALKSGGFSDIAKMIRSAAINYMGKSFDSPFWEQSAATLVKNCLIHCAATQDYYTLNDLYKTMVRAVSDDAGFIADLEDALKESHFDAEEKTNIAFALQYFRSEYKQLDEKVRTGVLATSTTFLNQFQEYQASQIFCPKKENLTILSMDDILDEGKILLFDVTSDGLARSMGTFVKLHYEKSLLNRLKQGRSTERAGVMVIDEYQDVVTTGYGADFGDETFLAESREANAITIAATHSLSSLENAIGRDKPTLVLWGGFRTKILGHSMDLATIKSYQELAGKEDKRRVSRSFSEHSQDANPDLIFGGFDSKKTNISESVNTSDQKEYVVTAQEFSRLKIYEAFAMLFDGVNTVFKKIYLKPHFLEKKNTLHSKILKMMTPVYAAALVVTIGMSATAPRSAYAFPNVCTVMKAVESRSCLDLKVGSCVCGFPPRPCAHFSYYVPENFIEVMPDPKSSFFGDMPGVASQLSSLGPMPVPYGAEADDDTHSYQAHVSSVPFTQISFQALPCGGGNQDNLCFEAMSEHLGSNWTTGHADLLQPSFLAWSLSPKACLLKGAATSISGESGTPGQPSHLSCSYPLTALPTYPPSSHSACTGWGTFYPRTGVTDGPAQTTSALMVASRMKSLANEVFHSSPSLSDEIWQMIYPQSSSCFREGQNVAILDSVKNVRELGRLTSGKLKGYLFTVWNKVSCCRDLAEIPVAYAALGTMNLACQGLGGS